jgi:large subunit ribosomal protein L24
MSIRKGDMVVVNVGDDASSVPRKVLSVASDGRIVVDGVNRVYRHVKKGHPKSPQGGRLSVEKPIERSNVSCWCSHCGSGRRTVVVTTVEGKRVRACVKCRSQI